MPELDSSLPPPGAILLKALEALATTLKFEAWVKESGFEGEEPANQGEQAGH